MLWKIEDAQRQSMLKRAQRLQVKLAKAQVKLAKATRALRAAKTHRELNKAETRWVHAQYTIEKLAEG